MAFDFEKNDLCVVRGTDSGLVCRQPARVQEDGDFVSYFDMTHERRFEVVRVVQDSDSRFEFESVDQDRFVIEPMTMENYRKDVQPNLVGDPGLKTDADLRRHFLTDTPTL